MCKCGKEKIIKTTGTKYYYMCFECGEKWEKKKGKAKKKNIIKKIMGR